MIIADTNVFSEPFRVRSDAQVIAWLRRNAADLAITSITVHELWFGAMRLPVGKRRDSLISAVGELVEQPDRLVLPFDEDAAGHAAMLRTERERAGRPVSIEDLMIAGIARARGAAVATRNVEHFEGFGVEVINPWSD